MSNFLLKFADETKLFGKVKKEHGDGSIQRDLDRYPYGWSLESQMLFNITFDKCVVMHFGRQDTNREYTIGDKRLVSIRGEKDLGFIIAEDLKVSEQCISACQKANIISHCYPAAINS